MRMKPAYCPVTKRTLTANPMARHGLRNPDSLATFSVRASLAVFRVGDFPPVADRVLIPGHARSRPEVVLPLGGGRRVVDYTPALDFSSSRLRPSRLWLSAGGQTKNAPTVVARGALIRGRLGSW